MSTGIIVATEQELLETKNIMEDVEEKKYYDLHFFEGKINEKNVIVVKCDIGKVNAARTAQILIDNFKPEKVINIGVAGAINPELNVKDIVIGEKLVQYDFDVSSLDDTEKGEIQGVGKFIESDKSLIEISKKAIENKMDKDFKAKIGIIASADIFCSDRNLAEQVRKEFGAECVEMEGAAIAQICYLDKVPFLVIRGISDTPNGNNKIDYYTYCKESAKQAAEILKDIIV